MKKRVVMLAVAASIFTLLTGCGNKTETKENVTESANTETQVADSMEETEAIEDTNESETVVETAESEVVSSVPEGDIVDGTLATKENPVPLNTWASVTVSDGGWPKQAYVRIISADDDQEQAQAALQKYNSENSSQIEELEEHAEFLDYIVVEYEVFFPSNFTDSESIAFSGLVFDRENNQEDWIASDGSNYYWMGAVTTVEYPTDEAGKPHNGDTVKGKIMYPMIKGNTDYTLHYSERTEDLSDKIDTYFAIAE